MGSKAPVARKPSQDDPPEESRFGAADLLKTSTRNQCLERIADALQVPAAMLFNPPNAVIPARVVGGAPNHDLDQECEALLHAYRCISDPAERQRLLSLVQAIAERS